MIGALTQLLFCQLAGELVVRALDVPVPGPVLGFLLLLGVLFLRRGPNNDLRATATGLLGHLSLLFVPAGVGVMLHLDLLAAEWLALAVALIVSTALTIAVAAGAFVLTARALGDGDEAP